MIFNGGRLGFLSFQLILFDLIGKVTTNVALFLWPFGFQLILFDLIGKASREHAAMEQRQFPTNPI